MSWLNPGKLHKFGIWINSYRGNPLYEIVKNEMSSDDFFIREYVLASVPRNSFYFYLEPVSEATKALAPIVVDRLKRGLYRDLEEWK